MEIKVIRAGMLTTVQDLGRRGHLSDGVPNGGAADPFALRVANLLVGNAEGAAGLEITLTGPELEFSEAAWVAVGGARFAGVPAWRPMRVPAGGRLKFGRRTQGCRAYLAVGGGLEAETFLGSRGTCLAAAAGGFQGRALRDGDLLRSAPSALEPTGHWSIDERLLPAYAANATVRVMPGQRAADFGGALFTARFAVNPHSDRMGIRLEGRPLGRRSGLELLSSAVAPGTIQVPPDGNPIVLLADAQTLGGYPCVAHAAGVDLPLLAQLSPGDSVLFVPCTLAEAHALAAAQEHGLALLRQGLAEKFHAP